MNFTDVNAVKEPFALKIVLRLFYVMVFFVGLSGNLLVCIVVVQQRRMRTVVNYFTLNLAVSDLIVIMIYLPSQLAAYENNQNWPLGHTGCRIIYSIVPVCLTTSIATLLAISCERFRGIVFPFQPRLRLKTVHKIILLIWLVSLSTAMPLMFVAGIKHKGNKVFCDEHWPSAASFRSYWIAMFLVQYVIPLFVMIVLYGIAGWKLRRRSLFSSHSINAAIEIARQRQSQKITKMLVALILLYSFCMLPQHVIYFWSTYGNFWNWKYSLYVFRISNLFPMANSALNSIAYGTLQADFRKAYKKFFKSYSLCSCTKRNRSKLNRSKSLKRNSNGAIKRKDLSQNEDLKNSFSDKMNSELNVQNSDKLSNITSLMLVSSDSHSCLLSKPSKSLSSKQDNYETPRYTQRNGSPGSNGLRRLNKTNQNDIPGRTAQPARTFAQVINSGTEEISILDKEDPRFILDKDVAVDDFLLFESVKETTL